jgi:dsDNA-binding SOS-regulon protein
MTRLPNAAKYSSASKYRNIRTEIDGITFDSKAEAKRYEELKMLQQAGEIIGFNRQPSFVLDNQGTRYRPDFIVADGKGVWVEDVKGIETPVFKLKRKMWIEKYPWLPLVIIK